MAWLDKFPGTPRPVQAELIRELEAKWDEFDVFVISAPTGTGKSKIAECIANNTWNCAYLTPTNQLLDQYVNSAASPHVLRRREDYACLTRELVVGPRGGRKYISKCAKTGPSRCENCLRWGRDSSWAFYRTGPLACNYHTYMIWSRLRGLSRDVLILDEAHNTTNILSDQFSKYYWEHDYEYPDNAYSYPQLLRWAQSRPPEIRAELELLETQLVSPRPKYVVSRELGIWSAGGVVDPETGENVRRGEPVELDRIKLTPVDISNLITNQIWSRRTTKKLVLMSATIGREDVLDLGLHTNLGSRICFLECNSPIPPESRPVYFSSNMSTRVTYSRIMSNSTELFDILANTIIQISAKYPNSRGVVHATYQLASKLVGSLPTRFKFHTKHNKKQVYSDFISGKLGEDAVLVASGMYEGIDLPGDLGRFQIISKIPWPSLGNPGIRYKSEMREAWYIWECLKTVMQACGRISRGTEDWGDSYIIDYTFLRLMDESVRLGQLPKWFDEAVFISE